MNVKKEKNILSFTRWLVRKIAMNFSVLQNIMQSFFPTHLTLSHIQLIQACEAHVSKYRK